MAAVTIHKARTDEVELSFGGAAQKLSTAQFHALIKVLKRFDAKKWDKDSLILLKEELGN